MSSKAEKAKRRKDQKEKAKGSESSAAVADGATLAMILSVCNTVLDGMDVFTGEAVDEEMILAVDACSASLESLATATARGLGPTIPVALHERLKGKFPAKSAAGAWFAGVDASVKGLNGEIDVDELLLLFGRRF